MPRPEVPLDAGAKVYLSAMKEYEGNMSFALEVSGLKYSQLKTLRRHNVEFLRTEKAACGGKHGETWGMRMFLLAYEKHFGNTTKAKRETHVDQATLNDWLKSGIFRDRMQEIDAGIHDEVIEQTLRLGAGKTTRRVDPQHNRWLAGKLDSRFRDAPKQVEHTIREVRNLTVEQLDEEIALLEK